MLYIDPYCELAVREMNFIQIKNRKDFVTKPKTNYRYSTVLKRIAYKGTVVRKLEFVGFSIRQYIRQGRLHGHSVVFTKLFKQPVIFLMACATAFGPNHVPTGF